MNVTDSHWERLFPRSSGRQAFQAALIGWFREKGRDYPWRRTRDPYAILVSELMLQQTRIATVLQRGYFTRWMERFPDVSALARAEEDEVLKAWEGLGYYNRARNLQRAAQAICADHGGDFPSSLEEILALPGVGPYTAGAVMSFAYGERAAIVDGNVIRVMARLFECAEPVDRPQARARIWEWAERLTPNSQVREYNSAVMELGQNICTRTSPDCGNCPAGDWCQARKSGRQEELPARQAKTRITRTVENALLVAENGRVLLQREEGSRRRGLWKLPEVEPARIGDLRELVRFDYAITRFRVNLRIYAASPLLAAEVRARPGVDWFSLQTMETLPALGSPYRKALARVFDSHEELIPRGLFESPEPGKNR